MTLKEHIKPFLEHFEGFCYKLNNTSMFIFSMLAALIGVSQLPNYNMNTLECLLCLISILISFNYMLVYSRK